LFFLEYFKDFPDSRQPGKVIFPFDEVLLLCLPAVLAGAETFVDIARFGERRSAFCAGSGRFAMERPRTIIPAIYLPPSTPWPTRFPCRLFGRLLTAFFICGSVK
jgi:DDE_Tnp_1-associated